MKKSGIATTLVLAAVLTVAGVVTPANAATATLAGSIAFEPGTLPTTVRVDAYQFDYSTNRYQTAPVGSANLIGAASYSIDVPANAGYLIVFTPTGTSTNVTVGTVSLFANTGNTPVPYYTMHAGASLGRLAGEDRFSTAAAISKFGYPGSNISAVFIVNGLNFPDALGAAPAAAKLNGSVLLVTPASLPDATAFELLRLDPLHIYVIGGESAVSSAVFDELKLYSPDVQRISGANRYETSRLVARTFYEDLWTVYIANGGNFPDALAAGPAAGHDQGPVVLVNGGVSDLDSETAEFLDDAGVRVQIAGGPSAVSNGIQSDISDIGVAVDRRAGSNRYSTAAEIAKGSFPYSTVVYLATGANFPDALAGAALGDPILLVQKDCVPQEALSVISQYRPQAIIALGGTSVVSDAALHLTPC